MKFTMYTLFFTFPYTTGLSKISCQISIYYEQYNSCFLDVYFLEFTATINFPCSKSGLRIGENDVMQFSTLIVIIISTRAVFLRK